MGGPAFRAASHRRRLAIGLLPVAGIAIALLVVASRAGTATPGASSHPEREIAVEASSEPAGSLLQQQPSATAIDPADMLSVLTTAAKPDDAIPAFVLATPVAEQLGDPSSARRVRTDENEDLFVVEGREGHTCLVVLEPDDAFAATCTGTDRLLNGAILLTAPEDDSTRVYGVVADDVTAVVAGGQKVAVNDNTFRMTVQARDTALELVGRLSSRQVDLPSQ